MATTFAKKVTESQQDTNAQLSQNELVQKKPTNQILQASKMTQSLKPINNVSLLGIEQSLKLNQQNQEKSPKRSLSLIEKNGLLDQIIHELQQSNYCSAPLLSLFAILMKYPQDLSVTKVTKEAAKTSDYQKNMNIFYYMTKVIIDFVKQIKLTRAQRWINKRSKNQTWAFSTTNLGQFIYNYHEAFSSEDWRSIEKKTKQLVKGKTENLQTQLKHFIQPNFIQICQSFPKYQNEPEQEIVLKFYDQFKRANTQIHEIMVESYFHYIFANMLAQVKNDPDTPQEAEKNQMIQEDHQDNSENQQEGLVNSREESSNLQYDLKQDMEAQEKKQSSCESQLKFLSSHAIPIIKKLGQDYKDLIILLQIHKKSENVGNEKSKNVQAKEITQKKRKLNENLLVNCQDEPPVEGRPIIVNIMSKRVHISYQKVEQNKNKNIHPFRQEGQEKYFPTKAGQTPPQQNTTNQAMSNDIISIDLNQIRSVVPDSSSEYLRCAFQDDIYDVLI